jgi:hypothetical protein
MSTVFRLDREQQPHPGKHGGKRPGAGRPVGSQNHHRLTQTALNPQELRDARKLVIDSVTNTGRDPLLTLLEIASDPEQPAQLRVAAAGIAVRYCYPALSATQVTAMHATVDPQMALNVIRERLERLAPAPEIEGEAAVVDPPTAPLEVAGEPQPEPASAANSAEPTPALPEEPVR